MNVRDVRQHNTTHQPPTTKTAYEPPKIWYCELVWACVRARRDVIVVTGLTENGTDRHRLSIKTWGRGGHHSPLLNSHLRRLAGFWYGEWV